LTNGKKGSNRYRLFIEQLDSFPLYWKDVNNLNKFPKIGQVIRNGQVRKVPILLGQILVFGDFRWVGLFTEHLDSFPLYWKDVSNLDKFPKHEQVGQNWTSLKSPFFNWTNFIISVISAGLDFFSDQLDSFSLYWNDFSNLDNFPKIGQVIYSWKSSKSPYFDWSNFILPGDF